MDRVDEATVRGIVDKHGGERGALISVLQDIQTRYGYLPEHALRLTSDMTGRALVDVYGVATFYRAFSLEPRGKHLVTVCLGTACHVRGGPVIAQELERQLCVAAGQTTKDRMFTLETAACLGACALGPIVVVDGVYHANVKKSQVKAILEQARQAEDVMVKADHRVFPLEVSCPRCNHTLHDAHTPLDGYPSIRVTAAFERKHGALRLSCLYGSYNILCQHEIPAETVVNFFCPHCHAELGSSVDCARCNAPMVAMLVRGGGMVQICSRRGCKEHRLDVSGVNF